MRRGTDRRARRPGRLPGTRPRGRCGVFGRAGALAGAVLLLGAAACTGGDRDPDAAQSSAADVPGEIVVASGRDVTGKNGIRQQLIDAWNRQQDKENTGYHARLVELPGSADEQRSQLLGALQSGSADYDVVNLDVTWVPEFAEAGLIAPLPQDTLDGDVIGPVAATAYWKDQVYAVPFNTDVGLLYYRRDYLRAAGIQQTTLEAGTTWTDLRDLADTLDAHPPKGFEKAWTTQLAAYEGRTVNAVEAFASATKDFALTDGSGHYTASRQELADGIAELRRRTEKPYTLDHAFTSDEAASLSDFASGRTAFLRQWPYAYGTLHQTFSADQVGVAPLPGRAVLGGQNLAVARSSNRAGKAAQLIAYLTDAQSERCLLDAGFAATRTSAYTDDHVRCAVGGGAPAAPTGESTDRTPRDAAGRPDYARRILYPALTHAVPRPRTPLYGAFTQTFTTELGRLFTADPPSDAALAGSLDEALRKVLPGRS
ncbi:extracellular solute-binding protein [Streptomyces sp. NPDC006743]|uniref:extracellular solute-binding protein n=1 Tax=Streptomyces sp. NPDC006743 TaxID=3154480 RepID=UPI003454087B